MATLNYISGENGELGFFKIGPIIMDSSEFQDEIELENVYRELATRLNYNAFGKLS
ncbi:MAG: hypothetical protein PHF99_02675 [Bacteroidales bacterium]|nr:hypothetical protein [Bacteroidales bacterium]